MPTVFRLLTILAIIAAIVFAVIFALATFVTPRQGRIEQDVPITLPETPKPAPLQDTPQ